MSDDLLRLEIATHEAGHAIAWHVAGIPIKAIKLQTGWTGKVNGGFVEPDLTGVTTTEQARDALIGFLAGCEAGRRWSDENNRPHNERHCAEDLAFLHKTLRNDPLSKGLTERELRHAARKRVGTHWRKILTLADQLAAKGTATL